jgi:hypothetical protein
VRAPANVNGGIEGRVEREHFVHFAVVALVRWTKCWL